MTVEVSDRGCAFSYRPFIKALLLNCWDILLIWHLTIVRKVIYLKALIIKWKASLFFCSISWWFVSTNWCQWAWNTEKELQFWRKLGRKIGVWACWRRGFPEKDEKTPSLWVAEVLSCGGKYLFNVGLWTWGDSSCKWPTIFSFKSNLYLCPLFK